MLHTKHQSSAPSNFRKELYASTPPDFRPEIRVEFELLNNFGKASPKEHCCLVSSHRMTHDDGHWPITMDDARRLRLADHNGRCTTMEIGRSQWTTQDDKHWAITLDDDEH